MSPTVSFPVVALGGTIGSDFYQKIFKGITEVVNEDDVQGVQIYPAKWPRKVLITVKQNETKEALLISGLNIAGHHVDLKDENEEFVRVTIRDLSLDYPKDKLIEVLSEYGNVVNVEREMIYIDGRKTTWTTGTRWVSMCPIYYTIPQRLSVMHEGKQMSMSVWYKRPEMEQRKCRKCGGSHGENDCSFEKQVCFICQGGHKRHECPNYDGSRSSDEVFCFMSKKSPLSNFNTNYPITIDETQYMCNEMFIQQQKALIFGDVKKAEMIMKSTEPKEMKELGRKIEGYKDSVWKERAPYVIMTCNREKVYAYKEIQDYLLKTGNRVLGEATPDPFFGIGIHIGDPAVLNRNEWPGKNVMGNVLTELRSEVQMMKSLTTEAPDPTLLNGKKTMASAETPSCIEMTDVQNPEMLTAPTADMDQFQDCFDDLLPLVEDDLSANENIVLIGDTNLNDIELDLTELKAAVLTLQKEGAKTTDVEKLLDRCTFGAHDINTIIFHIGACDWSSDKKTVATAEEVYRDYVEALTACRARYADAMFVLSSILPRVNLLDDPNINMDQINFEVSKLNELLLKLSISHEKIVFVNNNEAFCNAEGKAFKDLFNEHDTSGFHLSQRGQAVLSDNLTGALREVMRQ